MGISTGGIFGIRSTAPFIAPPPPPPSSVKMTTGPIVVPSVIAPAAPPPATVATIVATQTQTAKVETTKAQANAAIIAANVVAAQSTAKRIADAVSTVPTFADQKRQASTAIVTNPAQRAQVAEIVRKAEADLATFQPSRVTDSGVVVTAKSPAPSEGGIAFGDLTTPAPIVPNLIAKPAVLPASVGPAGVAPGGASNAEGPSGLMVLALAVAAFLLIGKV